MPFIVWLSKIAASPVVANVLVPSLARALTGLFESLANKTEENSARVQAKAAQKIADNALRAEALRAASKKLSDATARN